MNGVAGTVVLYHPDEGEVISNIHSYLGYVDLLIVIDNTEMPRPGLCDLIQGIAPTVRYIALNSNQGIAVGLNIAAKMACEEGYAWLLTMDQDSFFDKEEIAHYFSAFRQLFYNRSDVAIVAPSHEDRQPGPTPVQAFTEENSVITSGNLINLELWKETGGFCEKLFIDEVDHEYCYRLIERGYRIIKFNSVFLNHQLGKKKMGGYLGVAFKRNRTVHAPRRVYFMVRNYLYVRRMYKKTFPGEFRRRDKEFLHILKNNLFFSGHFWVNLRNVFTGFRHYRAGNFSGKL